VARLERVGENMEDKKEVFLALLEDWKELDNLVLGEFSSHISEDLKELPIEVQKWVERYEKAR
jgi:hypothetical protein